MLNSVWLKISSPIINMKLKSKLLMAFFTLIILPFGIFIMIFNNRVSSAIETLVTYSARQSFEQSEAFISFKIDKMIDATNVILIDKKVNDILTQDPNLLSIYEQNKNQYDLSLYLSSFQNDDEIYKVRLFINDAFLYSSENENIFGLNAINNTEWFKSFVSSGSKILWLSSNDAQTTDSNASNSQTKQLKKVSAIRCFWNPNDYSDLIGILIVDILESNLVNILKKASPTQSSVTYIQNSKNEIIASSRTDIRDEWKFDSREFDEEIKNGIHSKTYNLKTGKILLTSKKIPNTDWIMFSIVPYNEILEVSKNIKYQMLFLFLLIGAIAYCIAYIISISITKRISLLINDMKMIKNGNFNIEVTSTIKDEIGELISNFKNMTERIAFLNKEQFRLGLEAKNAELIALQAQINPHFLYNTLDLINWTAINNNVPEIAAIVKSLSRFYKLSLSKGANIIPIKDELEHVKLYIDLQNKRFNNKISFFMEVEDAVYEYLTLKTILQPIVENSIIHGILKKKEKKGLIKLTCYLREGCVIFKIADDGIGMSHEKVMQILSKSGNDYPSTGYGIKNINERIKLYYGENYGISFESTVNKGTVATIQIPAQKKSL